MSSFDVLPTSLARADTRALATSLLLWPAVPPQAVVSARRCSSVLAHRALIVFVRPLGDLVGRALSFLLLRSDVRRDGRDVRCPVEPEGPSERPATLRQREAVAVGMQVRTPARHPTSRVGDELPLDRDDTQQDRRGGTGPAAHTRAHRLRAPRLAHPSLMGP